MLKDAVLDGFSLNLNIRYLPYHYTAAALSQSEVLRRANLYRARWVVMPDDLNTPIPAYDTFEGQIKVVPGAYLWGFQVNQFNAAFALVAAADAIIRCLATTRPVLGSPASARRWARTRTAASRRTYSRSRASSWSRAC
jgi:hypothetical protein